MILVDFNQIALGAMMVEMGPKQVAPDTDMFRHICLNVLLANRRKFKKDYGELVICCDSKSWRHDYFPYYKIGRKKTKDKSTMDWDKMHAALSVVRKELDDVFPYPVLRVEKAEADDIIGTLCHKFGDDTNDIGWKHRILILSGDKDFLQLQKFKNVDQFAPVKKEFLKTDNPSMFLYEHIMKGDTGDSIPNILSDDDIMIQDGVRQKPMTAKRIEMYKSPVKLKEDGLFKNFQRNRRLIDLSLTPEEIQNNIMNQYDEKIQENKSRKGILPYMVEHRLNKLMESINGF